MVNRILGRDFGFYKSHEIPKEGILEFDVFSDIHIVSDSMEHELSVKWNKAIESIKNDFKNSSGIMVCGDFAEAGEEYQFKTYFDILDKHDKELEILTAIGNHQVRWKDTWNEPYSLYMKYNKKYMGETEGKIYFDKWINGYHFIFLNTEWHIKDRAYISQEQLDWLDKAMGEREEEDKPVFLFLHQALRDTYWNSNEWDVGVQDFALKEVLRKHPKCIMFTGHIHNGLGKLDVLKTEYGIMVDVPGFRSNDYGDSRGEIGYHVSVNEDKVQISLYDYREHKWIKDYNYIVDLDAKFYEKAKILDIDFNNCSLRDKSSYNKLINIEEEFATGIYEGKALRIKDFKSLINKGIFDEENLIISSQNSEFTMLFWSKINCDEWHQIAVSKNNENKFKYHMDGDLIHMEERNQNDISLNKAFINGILKSTKFKENEIKELLIDELKVYKKALGSAELETAYNPFRIKVESNKIIISWKEFIDKEIEPAYIVLNGEKYCKIDLNENSKEITGLEPNKEYTVIIVDREKYNHRNFRNAYSFVIKTKNLI